MKSGKHPPHSTSLFWSFFYVFFYVSPFFVPFSFVENACERKCVIMYFQMDEMDEINNVNVFKQKILII